MPLVTDLSALKSAMAIIHRDREWWRKILVGAALSLTFVGYPIVEGFQLESIENTHNRFPTPLPRWNAFANKAIVGLLAVVIDFFYFVFPLLLGGLFLICIGLATVFSGIKNVGGMERIDTVTIIAIGGWLFLAWLSSISPVAKRRFVVGGQPGEALSSGILRAVWQQPARGVYLRARLRSFPLYLPPVGLLAAAWFGASWSFSLALLLVWLACAQLLYARLVVVQLYDAAAREIQQREFEAWQERHRS